MMTSHHFFISNILIAWASEINNNFVIIYRQPHDISIFHKFKARKRLYNK